LIPLILFTAACRKPVSKTLPVEDTRFLMDTVVRIAVYDPGISRTQAEEAIREAFRAMETLEKTVSSHMPDNDIARLNAAPGGVFQAVSPETAFLLETAGIVAGETGGAFDVSIGAVRAEWSFDAETPSVPDSAAILKRLSCVDYRQIQLSGQQARLARPSMAVDLGGIAKGLNIDRAVEVLKAAGVRSGLVDAGGDMRIFGKHPRNPGWRIGVKHPRPREKSLYGVIETGPAGIATSGDYERFFLSGGRRYHHILDPGTGFPAEGCVSVTLLAESAMLADAYATAVFVLGPDEGMRLIERKPGLEGMIILEKNGRLTHRISSGLESKIQF